MVCVRIVDLTLAALTASLALNLLQLSLAIFGRYARRRRAKARKQRLRAARIDMQLQMDHDDQRAAQASAYQQSRRTVETADVEPQASKPWPLGKTPIPVPDGPQEPSSAYPGWPSSTSKWRPNGKI